MIIFHCTVFHVEYPMVFFANYRSQRISLTFLSSLGSQCELKKIHLSFSLPPDFVAF